MAAFLATSPTVLPADLKPFLAVSAAPAIGPWLECERFGLELRLDRELAKPFGREDLLDDERDLLEPDFVARLRVVERERVELPAREPLLRLPVVDRERAALDPLLRLLVDFVDPEPELDFRLVEELVC